MNHSFLSTPAVLASLALSPIAQAAPPQLGGSLDYTETFHSYRQNDSSLLSHYDSLGASVLLDLTYLRLGAGYSHNFGNLITFENGKEVKDPDYSISTAHVMALAQYPLAVYGNRLYLWPALGLDAAYGITYDHNGSKPGHEASSPYELQLLAGGGLDYAMTQATALTFDLLGAYSLTPSLRSTHGGEALSSPQSLAVTVSAGFLFAL